MTHLDWGGHSPMTTWVDAATPRYTALYTAVVVRTTELSGPLHLVHSPGPWPTRKQWIRLDDLFWPPSRPNVPNLHEGSGPNDPPLNSVVLTAYGRSSSTQSLYAGRRGPNLRRSPLRLGGLLSHDRLGCYRCVAPLTLRT